MKNLNDRTLKIYLFSLVIFVSTSFLHAQVNTTETEYEGCTSILVGKLASVDGSTMTSHTCDSRTDRTWINIVPNLKHKVGSTCEVFMESKRTKGPNDSDRFVMGEIPQVEETFKYINSAYPIMNEHQLAIGETTFGGKKQLKSDEGMIDCPELYRLVLERARTAREAINIIDELTKEFGYNDVGECFTFADPKETWLFEILGPGSGKIGAVWAAVRIPDDCVSVSANSSRIRQLNLDNKEYFLASDNVFSLAEEMGWWSKETGEPFEFCYAYSHRNSLSSRRREWRALSIVAPSLKLNPNSENYPVYVKAENKLSVKNMLEIFRNTYQDTNYDMTKDLNVVDKDGNLVKSPVASPFLNKDWFKILKVQTERTIACVRATYVQVTQSRDWLPNPIGGVVWLGYDNPTTTPHIPFYIGMDNMPDSYEVDGREKFRRDCAWWAFRRVSQLALFRWQEMIKDIEPVWNEIESLAFENQQGVEDKALSLFKKNPDDAKKYLSEYSKKLAEKSVNRYWKLGDALWSKYTNKF